MKRFVISSSSSCSHALSLLVLLVFCASCSSGDAANVTTSAEKPQIPKQDFEWNGVFIGNAEDIDGPQVMADLTIRGKWHGKYFNVYMEQGNEYSDVWVENLIYRDKLYTITHKWHTKLDEDILGKCFENTVYNAADPANPLPITVDGLNTLLDSSRFVGLEVIDGIPMNHFRATCLSLAAIPTRDDSTPLLPPFFPIKIFSDIYVLERQSHTWTKWLQFGDGVGPDPQNDEWFLFDEWNSDPDDIVLPEQCQDGNSDKRYVQQSACNNLIPK